MRSISTLFDQHRRWQNSVVTMYAKHLNNITHLHLLPKKMQAATKMRTCIASWHARPRLSFSLLKLNLMVAVFFHFIFINQNWNEISLKLAYMKECINCNIRIQSTMTILLCFKGQIDFMILYMASMIWKLSCG